MLLDTNPANFHMLVNFCVYICHLAGRRPQQSKMKSLSNYKNGLEIVATVEENLIKANLLVENSGQPRFPVFFHHGHGQIPGI